MLRIRLRRVGKKKQPSYRIVVADVRAPRDGAIVEQVGHYNPLTDPPTIVVNADKVKHWMGVGAKPSDTVVRLLQREGILDKSAVPKAPAAAVAVAEPEAVVEEPEAAVVEAEVEEPEGTTEATEDPEADEVAKIAEA
jgi:small subunit ribosomal protein S16